MALKAGAGRVDFLDINPRALDFQRENAAVNRFPSSRFTSIKGDIADFLPERSYDLILANPPFVPTPAGLDGTITSNGGPDGNRFVEMLLKRLEEFLEPSGRALIYLFQLEVVSKCAVRRRRFSVGVIPTRQLVAPVGSRRSGRGGNEAIEASGRGHFG